MIRIIGGMWRGRKLAVGEHDGLRPTGNRLRETLFNWLAPAIHKARCLDAFAGTGALGLEALSRGARSTTFVELNLESARALEQNITTLGANAEVVQKSFMSFSNATDTEGFDVIFLDPPFSSGLWQPAVQHIERAIPLSTNALIYVEAPRNEAYTVPESWLRVKHKVVGQVNASLFKVGTESSSPL